MSKHAYWNERWSDIKCQCPQGKLHFKCENTKQWSDLKALGLTVHFAIQKGLYFPFCHQGISVGIQKARMVKKCVRWNKVFEYFIRSYSLFWKSWFPPQWFGNDWMVSLLQPQSKNCNQTGKNNQDPKLSQ